MSEHIKGLDQIKNMRKGMENLRKRLPDVVGATAVEFYKGSFRRQGYIDNTMEKWKGRKKQKKDRGSKRAILVQSGALRRSIRVTHKDQNQVRVGTDVPYARAHNDGATINKTVEVTAHKRRKKTKFTSSFSDVETRKERKRTTKKHTGETVEVKSHSRKMNTKIPRRQFMGASKFLDKRIAMRLENDVATIIKTATTRMK